MNRRDIFKAIAAIPLLSLWVRQEAAEVAAVPAQAHVPSPPHPLTAAEYWELEQQSAGDDSLDIWMNPLGDIYVVEAGDYHLASRHETAPWSEFAWIDEVRNMYAS